jgi:hypothetical protein
MRYLLVLAVLAVAACSDDSMTRTYRLSRDASPDTIAATQMPLSMPPDLSLRPARPGAIAPNREAQSPEQAAGSAGQEALIEAAGPASPSDIRTVINENSGLVYPDRGFVDRLMSWSAPAGSTPIITQAPQGGWFSRIF